MIVLLGLMRSIEAVKYVTQKQRMQGCPCMQDDILGGGGKARPISQRSEGASYEKTIEHAEQMEKAGYCCYTSANEKGNEIFESSSNCICTCAKYGRLANATWESGWKGVDSVSGEVVAGAEATQADPGGGPGVMMATLSLKSVGGRYMQGMQEFTLSAVGDKTCARVYEGFGGVLRQRDVTMVVLAKGSEGKGGQPGQRAVVWMYFGGGRAEQEDVGERMREIEKRTGKRFHICTRDCGGGEGKLRELGVGGRLLGSRLARGTVSEGDRDEWLGPGVRLVSGRGWKWTGIALEMRAETATGSGSGTWTEPHTRSGSDSEAAEPSTTRTEAGSASVRGSPSRSDGSSESATRSESGGPAAETGTGTDAVASSASASASASAGRETNSSSNRTVSASEVEGETDTEPDDERGSGSQTSAATSEVPSTSALSTRASRTTSETRHATESESASETESATRTESPRSETRKVTGTGSSKSGSGSDETRSGSGTRRATESDTVTAKRTGTSSESGRTGSSSATRSSGRSGSESDSKTETLTASGRSGSWSGTETSTRTEAATLTEKRSPSGTGTVTGRETRSSSGSDETATRTGSGWRTESDSGSWTRPRTVSESGTDSGRSTTASREGRTKSWSEVATTRSESEKATESASSTGTKTDVRSETGTASGATRSGSGTESEARTGTETGARSKTQSEEATRSGTESDRETGSGTGSHTVRDTVSGARGGTGTGTGTVMALLSESRTMTGTASWSESTSGTTQRQPTATYGPTVTVTPASDVCQRFGLSVAFPVRPSDPSERCGGFAITASSGVPSGCRWVDGDVTLSVEDADLGSLEAINGSLVINSGVKTVVGANLTHVVELKTSASVYNLENVTLEKLEVACRVFVESPQLTGVVLPALAPAGVMAELSIRSNSVYLSSDVDLGSIGGGPMEVRKLILAGSFSQALVIKGLRELRRVGAAQGTRLPQEQAAMNLRMIQYSDGFLSQTLEVAANVSVSVDPQQSNPPLNLTVNATELAALSVSGQGGVCSAPLLERVSQALTVNSMLPVFPRLTSTGSLSLSTDSSTPANAMGEVRIVFPVLAAVPRTLTLSVSFSTRCPTIALFPALTAVLWSVRFDLSAPANVSIPLLGTATMESLEVYIYGDGYNSVIDLGSVGRGPANVTRTLSLRNNRPAAYVTIFGLYDLDVIHPTYISMVRVLLPNNGWHMPFVIDGLRPPLTLMLGCLPDENGALVGTILSANETVLSSLAITVQIDDVDCNRTVEGITELRSLSVTAAVNANFRTSSLVTVETLTLTLSNGARVIDLTNMKNVSSTLRVTVAGPWAAGWSISAPNLGPGLVVQWLTLELQLMGKNGTLDLGSVGGGFVGLEGGTGLFSSSVGAGFAVSGLALQWMRRVTSLRLHANAGREGVNWTAVAVTDSPLLKLELNQITFADLTMNITGPMKSLAVSSCSSLATFPRPAGVNSTTVRNTVSSSPLFRSACVAEWDSVRAPLLATAYVTPSTPVAGLCAPP